MVFSGIADEAGSDIASQIKAHKELGWNAIELRLVNGKNVAGALSDSEFDKVRAAVEESGLQVTGFASAIGNWSRNIRDDFSVDLEELKTAAMRMRQLGTKCIRTMSWVGDGVDESEWRDEAIRRCRELAKIAEDHEIILMHENCTGWGGLSARHMVELKEAVDSPGFKLLYDIGNTISHGYDPQKFFQTIRGQFDYIHIKDARKNPAGGRSQDYVYCGEGDARLREILSVILNEDRYDGVISIEPHVSAIAHDSSVTPSAEDMFNSYLNYGRMAVELVDGLNV